MNNFLEIIDRFAGTKILILGDLMLDHYTSGDAERVSPEAPVLVLRVESEEARPGGAASVAALLRGLDAEVIAAGVIGQDANGRILRALLHDDGINDSLVIGEDGRRTTTKERFLGRTMSRHAHQMLRVDFEHRHAMTTESEDRLAQGILEQLSQCAGVLVSDYAKGSCTPALLRLLIDAAKQHDIPVVVDPSRGSNYDRYCGATVVKPNRIEAQEATSQQVVTSADAFRVATMLCERHRLGSVVITLDQDGMVVCTANHGSEHYPAQVRAVCDVTGAGDMVLSVLGLCLANGVSLSDAAHLANLAAGLEVERQGVGVITRSELVGQLGASISARSLKLVSLEQMVSLANRYHSEDKRIVFTNGCFDLLHVGHVTYLQAAAQLGDVLIVAINSDASVRRMKGSNRPVISEQDRASILSALSSVAHVLIFDDDTPHHLLQILRPDILVKGGTYTLDGVVGRDLVEAYGGRVCTVGLREGISTTNLLSRIRERIES